MEGKIPAKEERVHDGQTQSNIAQTRLKEEERKLYSKSCDCAFGLNVLICMLIKDSAKTMYI